MYQKIMSDRYHYIKTFCHSKTLDRMLLCCTYNGAERHVTHKQVENAASKANEIMFATVHVTDDDVRF